MVILITGITSGFGRAMAARLSADGHKVYGTHRKATDLLPGVTYIQADAQRAEDCEAAVKQVLDAEGRIDVFITPVIAPAVPENDVLIRFALMATHTTEQVDEAVETLSKIFRELDIIK